MNDPVRAIRIGTMAGKGEHTAAYVRQILPHGFECFEINFWKSLGAVDLPRLAAELRGVMAGSPAIISSLGFYGNPLLDDAEGAEARAAWESCIDHARDFGTDLVCGFTGALPDRSIPDNLERFMQVWEPLARRAAARGVRIGFENCPMGGSWKSPRFNLAINPDAWELLFAAVPGNHLGLEWEPCHQLCQLIDPIPQLRRWTPRIFHIHGKDATIDRDVIARHGIVGSETFAFHRTPGFGDSDWTRIISDLRRFGYQGHIDIEGWHDPVYRDALEMSGQVFALKHLQQCRGGDHVANPVL